MRKKIISALLIMTSAVLMTGCGSIPFNIGQTDNGSGTDKDAETSTGTEATGNDEDGNDVTESSNENTEWNIDFTLPDFPDPSELHNSISDFPTDEGTLISYYGNPNVVTIADTDGNIIYSAAYSDILDFFGLAGYGLEDAVPVAYDRGALIVEYYTYDDASSNELYALFPQNGAAYFIMSSGYSSSVTIYNNLLYITYTYYSGDTNICHETAFMQDASACSYVEYMTTEIAPNNTGFIKFPIGGDSNEMSLTKTLETCGYFAGWTYDDYTYVITNNNDFIEGLPSDITDIVDYDSSYIICKSYVNGPEEYCFYDLSTYSFTAVTDTNSKYLAYENGCFYYAEDVSDENGNASHDVYMFNIYDGSTNYLFSCTAAIGNYDFYVNNTFNTVHLLNGNIYYIDYNGISGNLFKCTASEDGYHTEDTGITLFTYDWATYGTLSSVRYETTCPYCGTQTSLFTSEVFNLSDNYASADIINSKLNELTAAHYNSFDNSEVITSQEDCEYYHLGEGRDYYSSTTEEWNLESLTILSDHYLAVEMSGYWYGGGVHGSPYMAQYLFDIDTGDYIQFSDLYTGTEENLKSVIAEATRQNLVDQLNQYDGYCDYYTDDPDEVYNEAYDLVSLYSVSYEFTEDGINVLYAPYDMGPYASGFITVTVSYESLGITLF